LTFRTFTMSHIGPISILMVAFFSSSPATQSRRSRRAGRREGSLERRRHRIYLPAVAEVLAAVVREATLA
jgi:hypothetical protein